jgi:hypothetical protein
MRWFPVRAGQGWSGLSGQSYKSETIAETLSAEPHARQPPVCVCVQLSIVNCPTCWYASLACLSRLPSDPFIGSRDCRYSMSMGAVSHNTSVAIALGDVRYMASIVREVKASCVHRRKHSDDYFEVSNIGRPLLHADGIERL